MARKRGLFSTGTAGGLAGAGQGIFKGVMAADEMKTSAAQREQLQREGSLQSLKGILEIENAAKPVTTTSIDPKTGQPVVNTIDGTAPNRLRWLREQYGIPVDEEGSISAGTVKAGGGSGGAAGGYIRGSFQQTQLADEDGTPLFFDAPNRRYVRADNGNPPKRIGPFKGNQEAIKSSNLAANILPKVDVLFDSLEYTDPETKTKKRGGLSRRMMLAPGVMPLKYPQIQQAVNELSQTAFSIGGQQLTEQEKKIVLGSFIPNSLDDDKSIPLKREALKGYLAGRIDLSQAANLLGPAGRELKELTKKYGTNPAGAPATPASETPEQRKARLLREAQGI